jgi:hypothetical protein
MDVLQPLVAAAENKRGELTNGEERARLEEALNAAQVALPLHEGVTQ